MEKEAEVQEETGEGAGHGAQEEGEVEQER